MIFEIFMQILIVLILLSPIIAIILEELNRLEKIKF